MSLNGPIFGRIVSWFVACLCLIAYITPRRVWLFMGRRMGMLTYRLLRRHRDIAERNIRFAIGDQVSEEEITPLIKRHFQQAGMAIFDGMISPSYKYTGIEPLLKRLSFEGLEHLEEAKAQGKSILLLNAHFGMVEYANLLYTHLTGRKLNFILRRFDNPYLQKVLFSHNERFGIKLFPKQTGLRPVTRNLLRGEDLIIFPDQASNLKEGINSTIFGRDAITLSLLPALALKLKSPILPMFMFRQDDDPVKHKLIFFPPIIPTEGDTIESLTQRQNDAIEKAVRMQPDHWLWLHRRWKEETPKMYK